MEHQHWIQNVSGKSVCRFPVRDDGIPTTEAVHAAHIDLFGVQNDRVDLISLYTAWGIILRLYTGSEMIAFSALTGKSKEGIPSNETSITIFEVEVDGQTTIKKISDDFQRQTSQSVAAGSADDENWADVQGVEVPYNTLVVSDISLSKSILRDWHRTFPIIVMNCPDVGRCHISYASSHLSPGQARNLAQLMEVAMSRVLQQPDTLVGMADFLPEGQKLQIHRWNSEPPKFVDSCIHYQLQELAAKQPDEIAVDAWDGQLTYSQLSAASSGLATRLRELNVMKGDAVMILSEKSKFSAISYLAVFTAGAVVIPVDAAQPLARLQQIMTASRAVAVISTQQNLANGRELSDTVCLVDEKVISSSTSPSYHGPNAQPNDIAYILFTSGSTGTPKGVTITHSAWCSGAKKLSLTCNGKRMLQFASFAFAPGIYELLMPVCVTGGRVCIPSEHDRVNNLTAYMNDTQVDCAILVPSVLRSQRPETLQFLKTLLVLGESLPRAEAARWTAHIPNLVHSYASSENALVTLHDNLAESTDIRNVGSGSGTCWIVDPADHNRLQPIGTIGEAVVYSPSTASSYLGETEKTRDVFVNSASWMPTPREGFRFCLTGDLMYLNANGTLSFSGRKDMMVKVRGQRIELPEVERSVMALEQVRQAMVCVPKTGKCAERLTVILTLKESLPSEDEICTGSLSFWPLKLASKTIETLRAPLLQKLPDYMVPAAWIIIKNMPLTPSRKPDRVPMRDWTETMTAETYEKLFMITSPSEIEEPINATEKKIRDIWANVLHMEPALIGRNASFINLGGDSVSAMAVISLCREQNIVITVRDVVRSGTIAELAEVATTNVPLGQEQTGAGETTVQDLALASISKPAGEDHNIASISPCSPMQESLYLSQLQSKGSYDCSFIIKLSSDSGIDAGKVANAWQSVVNRHSILRTIFIESQVRPGSVDQVILRSHEAEVSIFNFQNMAIDPLTILEAQAPIIKEGKPSHSMIICQTKSGEAVVKLNLSHLIFDGYSMMILLADLRAAIGGTLTAEPGPHYTTYVDFLSSQNDGESLEYWKTRLSGLEPCNLPILVDEESKEVNRELKQIRGAIPSSASVASFAKSQGVTVPVVLQMAWAIVLRRLLNRDDVVFGLLTSGRESSVKGVEHMVGPLINILVRRYSIEGLSVSEALKKTQDDFLDALDHQNVSLGRVQHALGSSQSLFSTAISIMRSIDSINTGDGPEIHLVKQYQPTEFDITLNFTLTDNDIELDLDFWNSKISQAQADSILATYLQAVQSLISTPSSYCDDIDILSRRDLLQIHEFGRQTMAASVESTMQDEILKICRQQPDAEAIYSWDGDFSYKEIDDLSALLAKDLLTLHPNLKKGSFIPICTEKCRWSVIAMLGVLRAGCAFIPLDPSHPQDRLKDIISQAGANVIIVTSSTMEKCKDLGVELYCTGARPKSQDSLLPIVCPDDDAYVIFTSGSTGKPKGVVIQHRAMCSSIEQHSKAMRFKSNDRVLQFSSFIFDACIAEIFTTLKMGGCVCMPSDTDRIERLAAFMTSSRITWAFFTPSLLRTIRPEEVPFLKTIVVGGEPIAADVTDVWAPAVELIIAYGPTECTVFCSSYPFTNTSLNHTSIGTAIGSAAYLVEPNNSDRLVPIGSIGELIMTGPILSRGYLGDFEKTAASFISGLKWADSPETRFYRTGDLIRLYSDGNMTYVGRKDSQVKLRGQRIELAEIEYAIPVTAAALLPREGPCQNRIVAVISLSQALGTPGDEKEPELVDQAQKDESDLLVQKFRETASKSLAPYMVPTVWIVLKQLPALTSGKVNRKLLSKWLSEMSIGTYAKIVQEHTFEAQDANEQEAKLLEIVSEVLNKPRALLNLKVSFIAVGGDSISSMQLTARCLSHGYRLQVRDVLQAKSLSDLSSKMVRMIEDDSDEVEEICDIPFNLSPVQRMHFADTKDGVNHFNQSYLVKLLQKFTPEVVKTALEDVVGRHGMLRARFQQHDAGWKQHVQSAVDGSMLFETFEAVDMDRVLQINKERQRLTNFTSGPLLVVAMIQTPDEVFLSLICHHLVVDLVSWRIILSDLEDILRGRPPAPASLPFQSWLEMQHKKISEIAGSGGAVVDLAENKPGDYWSMDGKLNNFEDVESIIMTLTPSDTDDLLRFAGNGINVEPTDVIIAAMLHSFNGVFSDRPLPSVFIEHHGRGGWDNNVNVSRTVGWFTTISPITAAVSNQSHVLEALKLVKNVRRSLAGNGWQDFTQRYGQESTLPPYQMEILFNFFGQFQQFDHSNALFKPVRYTDEAVVSFDPKMPRMALFDISALIDQEALMLQMSFNKNMGKTDLVRQWMTQLMSTLKNLISELKDIPALLTTADFPRSTLSQEQFDGLLHQLAQKGIEPPHIEDLYPCTPIQQGILLSQQKNPEQYITRIIIKVSKATEVIDLDRLASSWASVTRRHAGLRTRFILSEGSHFFDQLVLSNWVPDIEILQAGVADPEAYLRAWNGERFDSYESPHAFGLLKTDAGDAYFCLKINHAIFDAHSQGLIMTDLANFYEGKFEATNVDAPSYGDYVGFLQTVDSPRNLKYWTTYLDDISPCHFPTLTYGYRGEEMNRNVFTHLDHLALKAVDFCAKYGITISNMFQVTWAIVLGAYTGSNEVCFGYLTSGRDIELDNHKDPHKICGPLINTLVFRSRLDPERSIKEMLTVAQDDYINSLPHQHCPLVDIQHELSLSGRALYNTCVSLFRKRSGGDAQSDLSLERVAIYDPTEYLCSLNVEMSDNALGFSFNYQASAVPDVMASYMADAVATIFSSILHDADQKLGHVELAGGLSMQRIGAWNSTPPLKIERCVHDLVQERAALNPSQQAICAHDVELTYSELDELSDMIARELRKYGVGPGVYVPLCFEKSGWHPLSMFGILKAGGVCVPLDVSHPTSRLSGIVQEVNAKILIASPTYADRFADVVEKILIISSETVAELRQSQDSNLDALPSIPRAQPNDPAVVIFTSGSTGKPKGIILEHSNLVSGGRAHGDVMGMNEKSRVMQFSAYMFDLSICEQWTTLMRGGTVCVPSEFERMNGLTAAMKKYRVNWCGLTPAVASFLTPDDVRDIDFLIMGGELVRKETIETLAEHTCLINIYGPAECSILITAYVGMRPGANPATLGPQVGAWVWLVDPQDHNRLVPVGAAGEILIEGPVVARGYLNEPEKTAAAFIFDPGFARKQGGTGRKMYLTGDLGRYNPDGSISFVRRKDNQVKIRGNRVELGEVETSLWKHPAVRHGLCMVPAGGPLKGQIVAILSLRAIQPRTTQSVILQLLDSEQMEAVNSELQTVKQDLANTLPSYMVPARWLVVQGVPLNSSGKLHRTEVKAWVEELDSSIMDKLLATDVDSEDNAPLTDMERSLQQIWKRVLNVKHVSPSRSFMSLGGDSLTAMQVVSASRKVGISVAVQDILKGKSLSAVAVVATQVETQRQLADEKLDVEFDLTPIQKNHFHLMPEGTQRNNQSFAVKIKKHVTEERIIAGLHAIVERHSMLRARFTRGAEHQWRQRITDDVAGSCEFTKVQLAPGEHPQAQKDRLVASANFDITKGPLFSAHFIESPSGNTEEAVEQYLVLIASHLVVDLVSWRVILQDLEDYLLGAVISKEKPLPLQVWGQMQAEYSSANHHPESTLAQKPPTPDYKFWEMDEKDNLIADATASTFSLNSSTTAALLGDANKPFRTEPIDLMMAAVSHSFHLTFGERATASLSYEGHGRESWDPSIDITNTVGWFTTISPLYCGENNEVKDTIVRAKDLRRRTPSRGWPFFCSQHLHEEGQVEFAKYRQPEILFNYVGMYQQLDREDALFSPFGSFDLDSEALNHSADVRRIALIDIVVSARPDSMTFTFVFNKLMKHHDRIRSWMDSCKQLLDDMAASLPAMSAELTMADMPLMPLNWDSLTELRTRLSERGITESAVVEEIYPLSNLQRGLAFAQREGSEYAFYSLFEIVASIPGTVIDVDRLLDAWRQVVDRHPMLRTIFLDVDSSSGEYSQVTLTSTKVNTEKIQRFGQADEALHALGIMKTVNFAPELPPHRVIMCPTNDKIIMRLEMDDKIIDGTSLGLVLRDLGQAYAGQLNSDSGPRYRDYVEYVRSRSRSDQVAHWKQYLEGIEPCYFPALLDGKPKPDAKGQHFTNVDIGMSAAELNGFCMERGVTMNTLLQTGWAIVLRAFTGSDRVCFGYVSAGRDTPVQGIEELVGPVINLMICNLGLAGNSTAASIVEQCQADFLANLEHQHVSLADMHQAAGHTGGNMLFNTLLSLQRSRAEVVSGGPFTFRRVDGTDPTEYMIAVHITISDEGADIDMHCQAADISPVMAENIASTFAQAIRTIVQNSSCQLDELELVSPSNIRDILHWNSQEIDIVDARVHDVISAQAQRTPDKEAVVGWDGQFTYSELEEASNRVAQLLRMHGVRSETIVPFCFEKSVYTAVAMLGILKAGGAFAALDPGYPEERLRSIVEDTEAQIILCSPTQEKIARRLVDNVAIISPSSIAELPQAELQPASTGATTDAAFIQFTSGTTGKPKGIVTEHRSLATSSRSHGLGQHIDSSTRALQFASYTFDISVEEVLSTLQQGGTVCVPSDYERMNELSSAINKYGANWADLTPTVASLIQPHEVPGFKTLCLGGEAVRQDVVDSWAGKVKLTNGYGPSEASICSVCSIVDLAGDIESTNIGKGFGCKTWVVDPKDYNRLAPVGTIGELLLEGPILARGYLKDPEKTSKSFIVNPAWAPNKSVSMRLYKTQDLVRYTSEGTLIFVGRSDSQVKIRGQRVELGDIEWNLTSCPDLDNILVAFPQQGACAKQLTAIVTLASRNEESGPDNLPLTLLRTPQVAAAIAAAADFLAERVPSHMIPQVWAVVNTLPLSNSGKLDRKRINDWVESMGEPLYREIQNVQSEEDISRPSTLTEQLVQKLVASVLRKSPEDMLISRSFLQLGGDSFSAMHLASLAKDNDLFTSVQTVLRAKSLSAIARASDATREQEKKKKQVDTPFELLPMQKLHFNLYPEGASHHTQSISIGIDEHVEPEQVSGAIQALVNEHSIFRTRFGQSEDGVWQQRVTLDVAGSFSFCTYDIATANDMEPLLSNLQETLDIRNGPLFQATLFNVQHGGSQVLYLVAHQLVVDHSSWEVILSDLESFLTHKTVARSSSVSFQEYCSAFQARVVATASKDQTPELPLPDNVISYWGLDVEKNTADNVTNTTFLVSQPLTSKLLTTSNESLSTKPLDVMLACLNFSFRQTFQRREPLRMFYENHERESWSKDMDVSNVVAPLTSLDPISLDDDMGGGIIHHVIRAKDKRRAMASSALQRFNNVVDSQLRNNLLMEVAFNFREQKGNANSLLKRLESMEPQVDGRSSVRRIAIINVDASIIRDQLIIKFSYTPDTCQDSRIREWIRLYQDCLQSAIVELQDCPPTRTLSDFPLLRADYESLDYLLNQCLTSVGISDLSNIEDIYPCTSIQQGMLLSRVRSADLYRLQTICEIRSKNEIDVAKLQKAWANAVARHSTLRTVIVEGKIGQDAYHQVVLKAVDAPVRVLHCQQDDPEFTAKSSSQDSSHGLGIPHNVAICKTPEGRLFLKLEMDHVLTDGASMGVLLDDLLKAYGGNLSTEKPLYSNYVSFLGERDHASDIKYWKDRLNGATPTTLAMPMLKPSPRSLRKTMVDIKISVVKLNEFCAAHNATLSNLLQLAWALVLRTYTNSEDVSFGYLSTGRDAPVEGITSMVGPLINMIPSRLILGDSISATQALEMVHNEYLETLLHQYISLAEIQHALNSALRSRPLFNTIMSIQRGAPPPSGPDGLSVVAVVGEDPTEYDCAVAVTIMDTSVSVTLNHWSDKISALQAEHIGSTYVQILRSILEQPKAPISQLQIVSPSNKQTLLGWNDVSLPMVESCLHTTFEEWVDRTPEKEAIVAADGSYTYAQLNEAAQKLAKLLRDEYSVGPETIVPLCFNKSSFMVVGQAAVMKAGGANVCLDPSHPLSRKRDILQDIGATFVITSAQNAHLFDDLQVRTLVLDQQLIDSLPSTPEKICPAIQPNNVGFVVFTSGSTGKPKGILLEHHSLSTSCAAHGAVLGFTPDSRVLQFAAYTFDISVQDHWTTLTSGGCICIPSEDERMNDVAGAIRRMNVDSACLTPTVVSLIDPARVPSLKYLTLAGEAGTKDNVDTWADKVRLSNCFGPAESSIYCTWNGPIQPQSNPACIGKPLSSRIWVTQPHNPDALVPIGCIGEICIEGPLLAREYLHDAEKTRESFIINPAFLGVGPTEPPRRLYRTGDLARLSDEGSLIFSGRRDHQVKLHGQRLELQEIEHHLQSHEAVKHAMVVLPSTGPASKKLVAVVTPLDYQPDVGAPSLQILDQHQVLESKADIGAIKNHLASLVPGYMVPTLWVIVNKLPLGPTGKLSRKDVAAWASELSDAEYQALFRAASQSDTAAHGTIEAPMSGETVMLRDLISATLGIDSSTIGLKSNFFALGGDSILAIKLAMAARQNGLDLSVIDIFKAPTLEAMGRITVEHQLSEEIAPIQYYPFSTVPEIPIQQVVESSYHWQSNKDAEPEDIMPATDFQALRLTGGSLGQRGYTPYLYLHFDSLVDHDDILAACQLLVDTHATLRTSFVPWKGRNYQIVWKPAPTKLFHYTHDADSNGSAELLQGYIQQAMAEEVHMGDVRTKFIMVQTQSDSSLAMRLSHAQYDGTSLPRLIQDLRSAYEGKPLSPTVPFSTFIQHLQQSQVAAESYWEAYLRNSKMTQLVSHVRPAFVNPLNQAVTRYMATPSLESGITFATALKVSWALTLSQTYASSDVVFGHLVSGRSVPIADVEAVSGPCVTVIPVRVKLGNQTMSELLHAMQDDAIAAMPHEGLGFLRTVEKCTSWPKWTRFSSIVQHQNLQDWGSDSDMDFGGKTARPDSITPDNDSADVRAWAYPQPDGSLKVEITFSDRTFDAETAERMLDLLCSFISQARDHPEDVPVRHSQPALIPRPAPAPSSSAPTACALQSSINPTELVAWAWNTVFSEDGGRRGSSSSSAKSSDYPSDLGSAVGSRPLDPDTEESSPSASVIIPPSGKSMLPTAVSPPEDVGNKASLQERLRQHGCDIAVDIPYYEMSASPLIPGQFVALFKQHGAVLDVEDIMACPSIMEQIALFGGSP